MTNTYKKILALPEPDHGWRPENGDYPDFSPKERDALVSIIAEEHLVGEDSATDPALDASTHAIRILGSFLDPNDIPLLIDTLLSPEHEENIDISEDLTRIIIRYQSASLQPCIDALQEQSIGESTRLPLIDILQFIAESGCEVERITSFILKYLKQKHFTREINAYLITALTKLTNHTHQDTIKRCFDSHLVDLTIDGDFEAWEIKVGLRETRTTPCGDLNDADDQALHHAIKSNIGPRPAENDPSSLFIYLLNLYSRDCSLSEPSFIDGYLTAVLLNPKPQPPSHFLPVIWDKTKTYQPIWESTKDLEFFLGFIVSVHNKIADDLAAQNLDPLLGSTDGNPLTDLRTWLTGFIRGFHAWPQEDENDDEDQYSELEHVITDVIFNIMITQISAEESGQGAELEPLFNGLKEHIYTLFKQNSNHLKHQLPSSFISRKPAMSHQAAEKISRNTPCPCGSGRKYKRCCMN